MSAFGNILGIRMTLLLGTGAVVTPAPLKVMEAVEEVEVKQSIDNESGFKLVLSAGRKGPLGLLGAPFVDDPRLQRGARVVVTMWNGIKPTPIFDGIVTRTQYLPGSESYQGRYILLGKDLSWVMDREEKRVQHPAQDETIITAMIAASYAQFGIVPMVIPPSVIDPPIPVDRVPQQTCTDLAYLKQMALRHGYKVFINPGPVPGVSQLYFGPTPIPGLPQKSMSVNLGPMSDAYNVEVQHNGETLTAARAKVIDRNTGQLTELQIPTATKAPLTALAETITQMANTRTQEQTTSGLNAAQVMARLMATVNQSSERVIKVTGTVDNVRYNAILKPYSTVQMRGLGMIYNGIYTVAEVRHLIKPGQYKQNFSLQRDGLYPIVPMVTPEVAVV